MIPAVHIIKDVACKRQLTDSVALTDHIRVLDPRRFEMPKLGRLSDTAFGGLELGLVFLFDIR
jgi:mRNA-degrading endonuclease toxin of MazEF toxin-antitoxin module